jgi:hypothetical protein
MATWAGIQNSWRGTPVPAWIIAKDAGGEAAHRGISTRCSYSPCPNRAGHGDAQEHQGPLCRTGPHACFLLLEMGHWLDKRPQGGIVANQDLLPLI